MIRIPVLWQESCVNIKAKYSLISFFSHFPVYANKQLKNYYVMEYALEYGFLRLSQETRRKLNISVKVVTLGKLSFVPIYPSKYGTDLTERDMGGCKIRGSGRVFKQSAGTLEQNLKFVLCSFCPKIQKSKQYMHIFQ